MSLSERRRWLFPDATDGVDPGATDGVDPREVDDRARLTAAEHPDLVRAIESGLDEVEVAGRPTNPHLHLALHDAVAGQIWGGDPPEVGAAVDRLRAAGYDRHEILHMLGSVIVDAFVRAEPFDRSQYASDLAALPGSWETDRLLDDDDEDDDEYEVDWRVDAARAVLAERGPLTAAELAALVDADGEEMEEIMADGMIALLADQRLGSVQALLSDTVFTHRMTDEEAGDEALPLGVDLAPVLGLLCCGDHIHLADGEVATVSDDEKMLTGVAGWLGRPAAGALVGFRLLAVSDSDSVLDLMPVAGEVPVPETIGYELAATFGRFGNGDGMPVGVRDLLFQLAVDAPALAAGAMAPLSDLLVRAGFEHRDGYVAPVGADWETFARLTSVVAVARRHGLDGAGAHALVLACQMCELFGAGKFDARDRDLSRAVRTLFHDPDLAEAFVVAMDDSADQALAFLARLRALAGPRDTAALAWAESLVAGRAGEVERADACLRVALAADPEHPEALEDAAWYASDRGDAAQAVRFLERLDEDLDEARTALLRTYAPAGRDHSTGRNDPCPCGSGRKYKHCCLHAPAGPLVHPLPERVRWIWEKLRWWLDRADRGDEVLEAAIALHGRPPRPDAIDFTVDFDIAASMVLFADGAVHDFLEQRGSLLPDDEANLVAQWALTERSLHEVVEARPGEGVTLRDLRTGDLEEVRERRGSAVMASGDLVYAHPVFDGGGHQFIGGIVPVPLAYREPLLALLDEEVGSLETAVLLGGARRPPELLNMEGEPTVVCEARYRVADLDGAAGQLDSVLERQEDGTWVEWIDVDGQRWLRGTVSVEGEELKLSANSEARFDRLRATVTGAVTGLELLAADRVPAAEIVARRHRRPPASAPPPPAEAAEALDGFMREKEKRWVDEPVPALAGLTPRQAAADPTRREDLVALLHEFDRMKVPPGAVSFDTGRLRELLGLTTRA